jgi:hypothetical protein
LSTIDKTRANRVVPWAELSFTSILTHLLLHALHPLFDIVLINIALAGICILPLPSVSGSEGVWIGI